MFSHSVYWLVSLCLFVNIYNSANAQDFIREEVFNENVALTWEPNFDDETIVFHITVATTGFVGFGISPIGAMTGADIVIGGVNADGTTYFQDYHATENGAPLVDDSQDWLLIEAVENVTHTELTFSRKFNTCDEDDNAITEGSSNFIWAFGATDNIGYHLANRGASTVNILDPPMPDEDLAQFDEWRVTKDMVMPAVDTSYWCTIHKRPEMEGVRHVVGFGPYLSNAEAVKHSHHIVIFECEAPDGQDPDVVFGPYVDQPGEECNYLDQSGVMDYCRRVLFTWATGGKVTMFPSNVGFPINETGDNKASYVKMEFHYDNPDTLPDVKFDSGLVIYHTTELRPVQAGLLLVDHRLWPTHIIPPGAVDYVTVGHCSPECTRQSIPEVGINIFNVFLHSHLAGRKLKLRHFRNGVELPWIANDQDYNFNFQQSRPLRNHVLVLPGDQLSYECGTDTSDRNTTTLSGLSTRHEMCESFSYYYPRVGFTACGSYYYQTEELFKQFGVDNVTWEYSHFDPTVTAPSEHSGKLWSEVLNEQEWTPAKRDELMNQLRYGDHKMYSCGGEDLLVTYPETLEEYVPPDTCTAIASTPNSTPSDPTTTHQTSSDPTTAVSSSTEHNAAVSVGLSRLEIMGIVIVGLIYRTIIVY